MMPTSKNKNVNEKIILILLGVFLVFIFYNLAVQPQAIKPKTKPIVAWYVNSKYIGENLFETVAKYKPDIVLLIVFAEDDIVPFNGSKTFDLKNFVDKLHASNVKVFYSYSLFSRSMHEFIKNTNLSVEKYLHISSYAKYLRENDPERYSEFFDYYLKRGTDPEKIPTVERKPVDGYYVEIGHYSMIDPLYKPYRDFLVKVVNETVQIAKPDGLSFDHIRFFTFDEGYNDDIAEFFDQSCGMDVENYTPRPPFILNMQGWNKNDETYYECRARIIQYAVDDILSNFLGYETFGTTMGMIDPARANGQYVEFQATTFDKLLLMAYDKDPKEIARNVRETVSKAGGKETILGISQTVHPSEMENIKAGLANGASGIYLLGYDFSDEIHSYLLEMRKNTD